MATKEVKSEGKKKGGLKLFQYFREVAGEVKKLTWLSKKELASHTVAVFVFVIVMAIIIYALDFVFGTSIGALESINLG